MSLTSKIIVIGILSVCIGVFVSFLSNGFDEQGYRKQLESQRNTKNRYFSSSPDSPMPDSLKKDWLPLRYFPIDVNYRITASVEKISPISYSDDLEIRAYLSFNLMGKRYRWAGLCPKSSPKDEFLLAFKDPTSGKSTYGGGRYVDVSSNSSEIVIDFNTAYSPYCAFNTAYVCPLAPPENQATTAIEAGEKLPKIAVSQSH